MNRFFYELKVIPFVAQAIAAICAAAFLVGAWLALFPNDAELRQWPFLGKMAFSGGITLLVVSYTLLIGYINGDARRRGMRYIMWTLLAIFIPNAIGIILYFILRGPLVRECPQCHTQSRGSFTFCPNCGAVLSQSCPACRRAVEPGWKHCARCGSQLGTA